MRNPIPLPLFATRFFKGFPPYFPHSFFFSGLQGREERRGREGGLAAETRHLGEKWVELGIREIKEGVEKRNSRVAIAVNCALLLGRLGREVRHANLTTENRLCASWLGTDAPLDRASRYLHDADRQCLCACMVHVSAGLATCLPEISVRRLRCDK